MYATIEFKGKQYKAEKDVVLTVDAKDLVNVFSGELDGQGYAIMNMKLPGGWAGHAMFTSNTGTIRNIAFINIIGTKVNTHSGIIGDNKGLIENIYVDYEFNSNGTNYGFGGSLLGYSGSVWRLCSCEI